MTHAQAARIIETEDYQPWALVAQAKRMMGVADAGETDLEHFRRLIAKRRA